MSLILSNWIRKCPLDTNIPNEIYNLIINEYADQIPFDDGYKSAANKTPKEERQYDYLFRLMLAGNSGVGKSSLLLRYVDGKWTDQFITSIGVDFKIKTIEIDGARCKLQIWDQDARFNYYPTGASRYRGAHAVLMVYDITDVASFETIHKWNNRIMKNGASANVVKIMIGNKSDLDEHRQVAAEDVEELCRQLDIEMFIETSAKTGCNVDEAFESIARLAYDNQKLFELQMNNPCLG